MTDARKDKIKEMCRKIGKILEESEFTYEEACYTYSISLLHCIVHHPNRVEMVQEIAENLITTIKNLDKSEFNKEEEK